MFFPTIPLRFVRTMIKPHEAFFRTHIDWQISSNIKILITNLDNSNNKTKTKKCVWKKGSTIQRNLYGFGRIYSIFEERKKHVWKLIIVRMKFGTFPFSNSFYFNMLVRSCSMRKFMLVHNFVGLNWIRCNRITNKKKIWKEREICLESRHFQIVRCEFLLFNFRCDRREGKEEEIETCIRILTDWKFVFSSSFHLEEEKKFLFHSLLCIIIVLLCMWMVFFFKLLFEC